MRLIFELSLFLCLLPLCCAAASPDRTGLLKRFLRYAALNTASDAASKIRPTTEGQTRFARLLVDELHEFGLTDAKVNQQGYVYATLPASRGFGEKALPVPGFIAHLDTVGLLGKSPVKPVVHRKYAGGDLVLPGDRSQVVSPKEHERLAAKKGSDIVTSDGRTVLGADDKAGIAEIMTAIDLLTNDSLFPHGPVKIAFTPDEETGCGMDAFDGKKWGADFAYTVDGEQLGELNDETFNATSAYVTFTGRNCHPGSAKGVMVNSLYAAAKFLAGLPKTQRPEAVAGRKGYQHPHNIVGEEESATVQLILRDFTLPGIQARQKLLRDLATRTAKSFPGIECKVRIEESYRNMKQAIEPYPFLIALAAEAMRMAGITPVKRPIRGGTDGARLSFKGIPCPNLFSGAENVHSRTEWVAVDDMAKSVETILNIIRLWPSRAVRK